MFNALYIGATGMQAQQLNLDNISNNLVNINTTCFKAGRVSFSDIMMDEASHSFATRKAYITANSAQDPGPLGKIPGTGIGVGIASVAKLFDAGTMSQTGSIWDVAIQGDGFLQVTMPDGSVQYTRGGTLQVNSDGTLVTQSGLPLQGTIKVPVNSTNMTISSNGSVMVSLPNQSTQTQVGQLELVRFINPTALIAQGGNLYQASATSGDPIAGNPGQEGIGTLMQGYLEGSNVQMVNEMVNMMVAQRTYEASVRVVQTSDELLGMVNNLRKS